TYDSHIVIPVSGLPMSFLDQHFSSRHQVQLQQIYVEGHGDLVECIVHDVYMGVAENSMSVLTVTQEVMGNLSMFRHHLLNEINHLVLSLPKRHCNHYFVLLD